MRTWSTSTAQIMLEGMRADFHKVDRLSAKVIDIVRNGAARCARRRRPAATSRRRSIPLPWVKTSGLISPDKWGNLPGGEVFTTPGEVNGTFVIDGVVGDWLCDRYGSLERHAADPARSKDNRLVDAPVDEQGAARRLLGLHAHRREQRPRRRVRHRHQHRAARTSSATSCRTRSFPASTSPSAIPTARTPAPTGTRPRTSTSSARDFDIWVDDQPDHGRRAVPHRLPA